MKTTLTPFHLLVVSLAGWLKREQQKILECLKTENLSCGISFEANASASMTTSD